MTDNASGQSDRSVQVKLVLLGMSSKNNPPPCLDIPHERAHSSLSNPPGEAAVGKSSVVLRFVCAFARPETSPFARLSAPPALLGLERVPAEQGAYNWCSLLDSEMQIRGSSAAL